MVVINNKAHSYTLSCCNSQAFRFSCCLIQTVCVVQVEKNIYVWLNFLINLFCQKSLTCDEYSVNRWTMFVFSEQDWNQLAMEAHVGNIIEKTPCISEPLASVASQFQSTTMDLNMAGYLNCIQCCLKQFINYNNRALSFYSRKENPTDTASVKGLISTELE